MNRVTFFTDGSCKGGIVKKPAAMGAGVVAIVDTREIEFSSYLGIGTNQQAELLAVKEALESIPPSWDVVQTDVTIYTDSAYAIGCLTQHWQPRVNLEIIQPLKALVATLGAFRMHHVPGHSGHVLNERAHQLAVQGSQEDAEPRPIVAGIGNPMAELLDEQQSRIESLVQTLQFYGDPLTYESPPGRDDQAPAIVGDRGVMARAVLAALGYEVTDDPFAEATG